MPSQDRNFSLTPYDAAVPAVRAIDGSLARSDGSLVVRYRLAGELERLLIPAPRAPRFADELWRHTCFELFVRCAGDEAYHEFNFSPSGEWAVYGFGRYRERAPLAAADVEPPALVTSRTAEALALEARVRLDLLSPSCAAAPLRVALSCVVEAQDGALAYWALRHPAPKPDFHHPDAFVLEFDEIRN